MNMKTTKKLNVTDTVTLNKLMKEYENDLINLKAEIDNYKSAISFFKVL